MIDGDAVIHDLVLAAPAEQVFEMFTDPQQLVPGSASRPICSRGRAAGSGSR